MTPRLDMRCSIARAQDLPDPDGSREWQTIATGVPCRWWAASVSVTGGTNAQYLVVQEGMFVDSARDVRVGDVVVELTDSRGHPIFEQPERRVVEHVIRYAAHIELRLRSAEAYGGAL